MADDDLTLRLRDATALLESIAGDRTMLDVLTAEERARLVTAAGDVFCPDVEQRRTWAKARRRQARADKVEREEEVLSQTGIRALRAKPVFTTPNVFPPENVITTGDGDPDEAPGHLGISSGGPRRSGGTAERHCYVCKTHYSQIHHFYDQLCPSCAAFNEFKRTESADLSGRVALLTGGRVKIGYQAGIKLLRAGAEVVVTTRFPRDAALRYAAEPDFDQWGDRLTIHGLDLRHTPSVEALCHHLTTAHGRLDYIVNNACQTVRRPPEFYRHMMELESGPLSNIPGTARGLLGNFDGVRRPEMLTVPSVGPASVERLNEAIMSAAEMSQAVLLAEDAEPYTSQQNGLARLADPERNRVLYTVTTDVLSELGIHAGDIVLVDLSAAAVKALQPLKPVIAQVYAPDGAMRAETIVRQFVPPNLLITNSRTANAAPINMADEDAHIKGVIVSWHRSFAA